MFSFITCLFSFYIEIVIRAFLIKNKYDILWHKDGFYCVLESKTDTALTFLLRSVFLTIRSVAQKSCMYCRNCSIILLT